MIDRITRIFSGSKKILAAAGLIFLAFLILDFNNRVEELFRLSAERDMMSTQVSELRVTEQSVQTQIAYAYSDAAAEKWAREEAFMARPGDKPIIMLPDPGFHASTDTRAGGHSDGGQQLAGLGLALLRPITRSAHHLIPSSCGFPCRMFLIPLIHGRISLLTDISLTYHFEGVKMLAS